MDKLVSIVMPSYNTGRFIKETLDCVLAQTYTNWELIIVDDCSTDDTDDVIREYLIDDRIRYIKNEKNSGAAISRNKALREAKGKWIAFLDSDDLWEPEKLERQIEFMETNGYKFTFTDYKIQLNGTWLPYVYTGPDRIDEHMMRNYCYCSTITVIYDREYVGLIQVEPVKKNNDYAMWLKIIKKTPCYRFPFCLSSYIKHDGSLSSGSKLSLIKYHYIMWRVAEKQNKFSAIWLTVRNLFWGAIKKMKYKEHLREDHESITLSKTF